MYSNNKQSKPKSIKSEDKPQRFKSSAPRPGMWTHAHKVAANNRVKGRRRSTRH